MKTLKITNYKFLVMTVLLSVISIVANAQKLPTEQQGGLRAPTDIRIDGKATEWNNKFQAYNKHTDFYYTLSNDDKNLYLIIQATDPTVIRRIINAGITFTINRSGKKNDKEGVSITYPVFDKNNKFAPVFKNMASMGSATSIGKGDQVTRGSTTPVIQTDSFINATNKNMTDKSKMIRVSGIKNVDSLISVYNEDGIKAAALFDNKMIYTYELAISLKNLDLSLNNPVNFAYQLKINEVMQHGINIPNANSGGDAAGNLARMTGISVSANAVMGQPATDFWGEYTLVK